MTLGIGCDPVDSAFVTQMGSLSNGFTGEEKAQTQLCSCSVPNRIGRSNQGPCRSCSQSSVLLSGSPRVSLLHANPFLLGWFGSSMCWVACYMTIPLYFLLYYVLVKHLPGV